MTPMEQSQFLFRHLLEDVKVATDRESARLGTPLTVREYKEEVLGCIQAYRDQGVAIGPVDVDVRYDHVEGKWHVSAKPSES